MTATKPRRTKVEPVDIPAPSLSRAEEPHWGDGFRAAYVQSKRHFEPGVISYEALAERVSQLVPTTGTSILRLGYADEVPRRPNTRQIAYLALVAMGFDPTQFDLTAEDRALRGLTEIEIRKMLDPGHLGFAVVGDEPR